MTQNTSTRKHSIFSALYRNRIVVSKEGSTTVDLPILIGIIALLFIPWLTVAGVVVALALGHRIGIEKNRAEFDGTFEAMVKNTAQDIKNAVTCNGQEPTESHT